MKGVVLMNTMAMKPGGNKPYSLGLTRLLPGWVLRALFGKKLRAYFELALEDPRAASGARFGLAHLEEVLTLHFTKRKVINLLSVLFEFGRDGYTREDLADWKRSGVGYCLGGRPGFCGSGLAHREPAQRFHRGLPERTSVICRSSRTERSSKCWSEASSPS